MQDRPITSGASPATGSARSVALVEAMERTLLVACVLVETGRRIDLSGLENSVGQICAAVLDLPAEEGRRLAPLLAALLARAETLELALRRHAPLPEADPAA